MNKIMVNGVEVKTNYAPNRYSYPLGDGYDKPTMRLFVFKSIFESEMDVIKRLVDLGYRHITFYESTTSVRGYHSKYALAK